MSQPRFTVNNLSMTVHNVETHNTPEVNLFVDVTNNSMNIHGMSMDLTNFLSVGQEIKRIVNPPGRRLNRRN